MYLPSSAPCRVLFEQGRIRKHLEIDFSMDPRSYRWNHRRFDAHIDSMGRCTLLFASLHVRLDRNTCRVCMRIHGVFKTGNMYSVMNKYGSERLDPRFDLQESPKGSACSTSSWKEIFFDTTHSATSFEHHLQFQVYIDVHHPSKQRSRNKTSTSKEHDSALDLLPHVDLLLIFIP